MTNAVIVTTKLNTHLLVEGEAHTVVPAELTYDPADPFAVRASFENGADTVVWVFARDLLTAGLVVEIGTGDVRVWPAREVGVPVVYVQLSSPEGSAVIEINAAALDLFLMQTYRSVPNGTEHMFCDIDAILNSILGA